MTKEAVISALWSKNFEGLYEFLRRHPMTVLIFSHNYTKECEQRIKQLGCQLVVIEAVLEQTELNDINNDASRRLTECLAVMARSEWKLFCQNHNLEINEFNGLLESHLRATLLPLLTRIAALEKINPYYDIKSVIVNEEYTSFMKALVLWAKEKGINVLHLLHSVPLLGAYTVHAEENADIYATLTSGSHEALFDQGLDESKIKLAGSPSWMQYKDLINNRNELRNNLCKKYGFDNNKIIITFFTTWSANLTAHCEPELYFETNKLVFEAVKQLQIKGYNFQLIIKDRPANEEQGSRLVTSLASQLAISSNEYTYTHEDTESLVTASDLTISIDSNIVIETGLAGKPAINIITKSGWLLGPCFAGNDGVIEIEPIELLNTLEEFFLSPDIFNKYVEKLSRNSKFIDANNDKSADMRVAQLIEAISMSNDKSNKDIDEKLWKTLGKDVEVDSLYHETPRIELFPVFKHAPQVVLEVGCAAGVTGEAIKQYYPGAKVYGVELNENVASIAKTRLDGVSNKNIESCDISELGIKFGTVDTFIAADVLEHLYNPWKVLDKIKPLLTKDAQVIVSIPNSQNAWLMTELASGRWHYDKEGLLDITHIRFFTKDEINNLFDDTGYDIVKWSSTIDGRVPEININEGEVQNIDLGKFMLKDITSEDWSKYRTLQFLVCATPREEIATYPIESQGNKHKAKKVVLYTFEQPSWACAELRVTSPLKVLNEEIELIWGVRFSGNQITFDDSYLEDADAFILHRFFPCADTWPFIEKLLATGKPVIYETDDLLCSIPGQNPSAGVSDQIRNYIYELLGRVDNVVVSTNKLAINYAPYAKNIYVVPNLIDKNLWGQSKQARYGNRPVVIGYLGTPTHHADLAIIENALFSLAEKYGNRISFRFMGCITERLKSLPSVQYIDPTTNYEDYVNTIKGLDIDIALAPLENNVFNRAKSNIKWIEYSYCGIPGVYANLEPYADSVINYETGILATQNSESWFAAIDYLVSHPEERARIGDNARNIVASHYTIDHRAAEISNVYRRTLLDRNPELNIDDSQVLYSGCTINQAIPYAYDNDASITKSGVSHMAVTPSIHLLLIADTGQEPLVESSLASLLAQDYPGWGLTVISTENCISPVYIQMDNLGWIVLEHDLHATIKESISATGADWVGFIQPGDQFDSKMLSLVVECFNRHIESRMIYLGMDYIDNDGHIKYCQSESGKVADADQMSDIPELAFVVMREELDKMPGLDVRTRFDHCLIANHLVANYGMACIQTVKQKVYHKIDINPVSMKKKLKENEANSVVQDRSMADIQLVDNKNDTSNLNEVISEGDNILDAGKQYEIWCKQHEMSEIDAQILAERKYHGWSYQPTFHMVCLHEDGQDGLLADTIDSLASQFYQEWGLSILSKSACTNDVINTIENIAWHQYSDNYTDVLNQVISETESHWIIYLQAGTLLEPNALIVFADYVNSHSEWRCIYSDHDSYDSDGNRFNPCFKPDINYDYLISMNYIGNTVAFSREEFLRQGGFNSYLYGENYDLLLRFAHQVGTTHIGHIGDVLFHMQELERSMDEREHKDILTSHFMDKNQAVDVLQGYVTDTLRAVYKHDHEPMVTIIIPSKDMLEFFQPCVESLFEKTLYSNYEVIVIDNNSDDPDVTEFYRLMKNTHQNRFRVVEYPFEFNYSAMINLGVEHAHGDYVLQLNNDTQIIQDEWLGRMMTHAQRPDVGIVGSKLLFPGSGKIQHAGVVLGMDNIAGHPYISAIDLKDPGYMNRAQVDQEYSAVTGACLLARKDIYNQVGGMDDESLKVSYNDVDLCLKVKQAGYKVLWTPYAILLHHGSVSQVETQSNAEKKFQRIIGFREEQETMIQRWRDIIANDSCYNKNLSLSVTQPQPEYTCVINWYGASKERPRIFGMPVSGGSGEYRVKAPLRSLARAGIAQVDFTYSPNHQNQRILTLSELIRIEADAILVQNFLGDSSLDALEKYKKMTDTYITYALDDLITNVPEGNEYRKNIPVNARTRLRKGLMLSDRLIVSTEPLRDLCRNMIDDIVVIPNYLETNIWSNLHSQRHAGPRPRVGWAGAQQHSDDLAFIEEVVKSTADEVDWVFFGMCPDNIRRYVSEVHGFEFDFEKYAEKLASLNLDLAVAPLMQHPFNEAKSNLRLLEYGAMAWPVICTDIFPYQNAPVKRVNNDAASWIAAIRERIHDLDAAYKEGDALKEWVLSNHMLDQHVQTWSENLLSTELKRAYQDIWQESSKLISR